MAGGLGGIIEALDHGLEGADGNLAAWLVDGGESRRNERGEADIIEADYSDLPRDIDLALQQTVLAATARQYGHSPQRKRRVRTGAVAQ